MKNLLKYSVLAVSIGLTTACSGGGGGGNNDKPNPAYDKKEVNTNTKVSSISYVRDDLKADVRATKELTIVELNTNKPIKTIQLSDYPKGSIKETLNSTENALTTYMRVINLPYSNTATFHTNETQEIAENAIWGGYPTKWMDLPKGSATYQGISLGLNTSGSFTLTADFDDKSVQGRIYNRRHDNGVALSDIVLERGSVTPYHYTSSIGNKTGTRFSGTAVINGQRDHYNGTFNGPNAEEAAGTVSRYYQSDVYEAFAGERQ